MKRALIIPLLLAASAAHAEFCSLSGEQISGLNKICYYHCTTGSKALTVRATDMCPITTGQRPIRDILASAKTEKVIDTKPVKVKG